MRKLSVEQQKQIIPDDAVQAAFMRRPDIAKLPKQEREARWAKALVNINAFRGHLSTLDSIVIDVRELEP